MSIHFQLPERLAGFAASTAGPGERVDVVIRELIVPRDAVLLTSRLEQLQLILFNHIPGFPPPSTIDNLVVVINPDLSGIAYVNEAAWRASVMPRDRDRVAPGTPVLVRDIIDIAAVESDVECRECRL